VKKEKDINISEPVYPQFENKPIQAIRHLKRVKKGECPKALYRKDIGFVSIIWGKVTDPVRHKGYGLSHIIDKHGKEIKQLGYDIEDFIAIAFLCGKLKKSRTNEEYLLETNFCRMIVEKKYLGISKKWVLTAFVIKK
jgi:hypothetical protein